MNPPAATPAGLTAREGKLLRYPVNFRSLK